jgi:hypothetical protein
LLDVGLTTYCSYITGIKTSAPPNTILPNLNIFSETLKIVRSFQLLVLADSDNNALEAKINIKTIKIPHLILRVG